MWQGLSFVFVVVTSTSGRGGLWGMLCFCGTRDCPQDCVCARQALSHLQQSPKVLKNYVFELGSH
jgi:hypothetical protein